jgi:hypothetical protein
MEQVLVRYWDASHCARGAVTGDRNRILQSPEGIHVPRPSAPLVAGAEETQLRNFPKRYADLPVHFSPLSMLFA